MRASRRSLALASAAFTQSASLMIAQQPLRATSASFAWACIAATTRFAAPSDMRASRRSLALASAAFSL
eukprot:CAMPEP_0118859544 /NCGR_PEP_ID=MMETSP1163-20130328/5752_1 /TAXON_ID=124430 /ORGANISM="Phaeomonas parva, Strain CCMP2877" /LENGTH=68 /DNA_ID=CAMNT_0006793153 /DNA_START=816 /DNA_END=1022 /DNA_ORIENTATION=-